MAWDLLDTPSSFVGQVFDRRAVRSLLERHDRGVANEESRLWTLLSLEVWHDTFFAHRRAIAVSTQSEIHGTFPR
jgi:asparagine synthase (glutamine-hydrolysing)